MAEVGLSIAAKLAEYLVDPTLQQLQYLFCVGKISRNVETRKEGLILKQGRVQERVEEAINKTEIQKWCPMWRRYCVCKKLTKTTQRMIQLDAESDKFNPFSHPIVIPVIDLHSSKNFILFGSTKLASDQLWKALQDDGAFIIGLFGMGGSGKTMLVKELGKKAKALKLFDRVVFTTVSQSTDIRKIQGEIADSLGLKLDEESEMGRARRIALRFQSSGERVLMILDDVWAKLNLEDIGNPHGGSHQSSCKVLITTRRQEVCTLMDCQKTIPLHLLTKNEAWILFQTHANVDDSAREVAQEIAKECKGLPIAIEAMGLCLKGKGPDEMNVVLHRLRHSKPINMDEGVRDAFSCLKLSYDYLRMPEAKLLFLVCAIFPEDHKIIIEDILRYGVGLGLCRDADSFEVARSQVRVALNILVDSSLLTYSQNVWKQECLTMHDMVCDVALWIASKEDCTIMVNCAKELDELLGDEAVKDCYAVSSWHEDKKLCQFPSQLDAPKLEILLLNSTKPLDLSLASFEGLEEIKVVAMVHDGPLPQKELRPQSMQWLSNLQTLRLQKWDLGDISFVVRLRKLEILDLCGSKFKKLPSGIENLNQLKLLDLSMCEAEECCCEVIGRCSQIEELYASRNFLHMGNTNCYECLVDIPAVPKLRRYILEMGQCKCPKIWTKGRRVLYLGQLNIFISSALIRGLGQKATAIEFYDLQEGCKSFIPDVVQAIGGMNELTKLHLNSCSEIEWLINETTTHEDVVVPRLAELELVHMDNLRQLCHGPSYLNLFQNLESLNIDNCPQLLNMFPADCNLGNLKKLRISSCPMLILFHASVACSLLSLRELSIHSYTTCFLLIAT